MGGCLACGIKRVPIASSDEQPKGQVTQHRTKKVPSVSADFWTTSAYDMDNSAGQSQGSKSSISTSIQALDPHAGVGSGSAPSEFVNHDMYLAQVFFCGTRLGRDGWVTKSLLTGGSWFRNRN